MQIDTLITISLKLAIALCCGWIFKERKVYLYYLSIFKSNLKIYYYEWRITRSNKFLTSSKARIACLENKIAFSKQLSILWSSLKELENNSDKLLRFELSSGMATDMFRIALNSQYEELFFKLGAAVSDWKVMQIMEGNSSPLTGKFYFTSEGANLAKILFYQWYTSDESSLLDLTVTVINRSKLSTIEYEDSYQICGK